MTDKVAKIFNGTFTLTNKKTLEYRTFRIRTQPDDAQFAPGKRVVALLTGPDNTSDYKGFAFVDDDGVHVWRKFQDSRTFQWYAIMLWHVATDEPTKQFNIDQYELLVEGRCIVCNRKLTTPGSIESGIGPVCEGRYQ